MNSIHHTIEPRDYGVDLERAPPSPALSLADVCNRGLVQGRRGKLNRKVLQRWAGVKGSPCRDGTRLRFPARINEAGVYVTFREWVEAFLAEKTRRMQPPMTLRAEEADRRRRAQAALERIAAKRGKPGVPPWTPEQDALLGTMSDEELGRRIGRSRLAVEIRRRGKKIPAFGRQPS